MVCSEPGGGIRRSRVCECGRDLLQECFHLLLSRVDRQSRTTVSPEDGYTGLHVCGRLRIVAEANRRFRFSGNWRRVCVCQALGRRPATHRFLSKPVPAVEEFMDRIIRVLVVDDSAYVRKVVGQMLSRSPFIEVVGTARDGAEALELVQQLNPDVVTCDLIMAGMDGVTFVREQMARKPLPVLIVSIANEGGELALAALDAGAIDFMQKPTALATEKIFEVSDELVEK